MKVTRRVKSIVLLAAIAAVAVSTALGVGAVARASTDSCLPGECEVTCPDGHYYAGFAKTPTSMPTDSSGVHANIKAISSTVLDGAATGWVGVNNSTNSKHIQAGIMQLGLGPLYSYIEYNNGNGQYVKPYIEEISYGTTYSFKVYQSSTNVWTAVIPDPGNPPSYTRSYSLNLTATHGDITSEIINIMGDGSCNALDYQFTSMGPWLTSNMDDLQYTPYVRGNVTNTSFEASGPQG